MRQVLLVMALVAAVLAGCGGDEGAGGGGGGGGSEEEMTSLTVGVIPISDVAPLYLGIQKGFFKEQNLDVKAQVAQGGAAIVTGVVSGDFDFGFAATEPLILAKAKGLPVKIVTTGNQAAEDPEHAWTGLMVKKDGPVKSPEDLEGRTIAANALQSTPQLATLAMLDKEGVDISKLKFIEVPFPDMPAALDSGQVAAVTAAEPFLPKIRAQGGRSLGPLFYSVEPGMTIGTYFALDKQIQENPDLVKRFATAMNQSLEYARAHQEEAREAITTYAKIPPDVLKQIELPLWSSDLRRPTIQLMADLCKKYGFIEEPVDTSELIWEGAGG